MPVYFTSDTIRVKVVFRDFALAPAVGAVVDPDTVAVNLYNADESILEAIASGNSRIVKTAVGNYYFDWVLPSTAGTYYIEFKGVYNDPTQLEPCITRKKVQVKFKPST